MSIKMQDSNKGRVAKILPFSAVDGPGNRTVVFLQSCSFNCKYCHNPETRSVCNACALCVKTCPSKALSVITNNDSTIINWNKNNCSSCGACISVCKNSSSPKTSLMSAEEVMTKILEYKAFISGITISGGECTEQAEFLLELTKLCVANKLPVLIDTNGANSFETNPFLQELVKIVSGFMLDVKMWNEKEHISLCGATNKTVIDNLKFLAKANKLFEVRTVIALDKNKELNNFYAETISKTADEIVRANSQARYKIIKYRKQGVRQEFINSLFSPDDEFVNQIATIAKNCGIKEVILV